MGDAALRRPLAILGAGGHAREQLALIEAIDAVAPRYVVEGLLCDPGLEPAGGRPGGPPILGPPEWLVEHRERVLAVCAIGASADRARVVERLAGRGVRFETLVHPSASVAASAELGEGAIVCAGAVVTSDVVIGAHTHVGVGSIVSHDGRLGDFVSLAPGCRLAGAVTVGTGAWLGVGTVVRDRIAIGAWATTGAGSVVVDDVPPDAVAFGVPARVVETRDAGWQRGAGAGVGDGPAR